MARIAGRRVVCVAVLFCGVSARAQVSGDGAISGTVTNLSGTPVGHAAITATNTNNSVSVSRESTPVGNYSIAPLTAGLYTVEVAATGFERLVQKNVKVESDQKFGLAINLTPGDGRSTISIDTPPLNILVGDTGGATIEAELYTSQPTSMGGGVGAHDGAAAAVPLFRDPVHDGAADPVVVWNRARKTWWMLYTNRRADFVGGGVAWVHGTHIGIAESADGGAHWKYVSEADIPLPQPDYTLWAPEVIDTHGTYHMFLTVVPGTFTDWNHPRHILHLTSKDLLHWTALENVNLPSEKTIDACVFRLAGGDWRLWYKNEAGGSRIWYSDSKDLVHWTEKGIAIKNVNGEGPVVFQWKGSYWMLEDTAPGLSAFRSTDLENWTRQPDKLLLVPGTQPMDRTEGKHPDVVVDRDGRAWLFYFTHLKGPDVDPALPNSERRTVLHVTELHEADGVLTVDRNAPANIHMLPPPKNKKSDGLKVAAVTSENTTPTPASGPVHVASGTMMGYLIHRIEPIYPADVHISGTVTLRATISKDGKVMELRLISGSPMLTGALMDAAKQWRYKPYLINGTPVDVETTISLEALASSPNR
jgi:hypothetical protein